MPDIDIVSAVLAVANVLMRLVPTIVYIAVATSTLPRRGNAATRLAAMGALVLVLYYLRFIYHNQFYIEGAVLMCAAMALAMRACFELSWREAGFYGSAIMLCQHAVGSAFIDFFGFFLLAGNFNEGISGASPVSWLIEWASLAVCLPMAHYFARMLASPTRRELHPWYALLLLIPLLFQFFSAAQFLPLVDSTYSEIPGLVHILVPAVAALTVCAFFFPISLTREAEKDRELAEMRRMVEDYHARLLDKRESDRRVASIMHDLANHLSTIDGLAPGDRRSYVDGLRDRYLPKETLFSNNATLNLVLNDKTAKAREKGVELTAATDFSDGSFVEPIDVCVMFGNALDNAIDAAAACADPARRRVSLNAFRTGPYITVEVRNYFEETPRVDADGSYLSSKRGFERTGLGISGIRDSVEKYGGALMTAVEDGTFLLRLNIPLP